MPLFRNRKIVQQPVNLDTLTDRYVSEATDFIDRSMAAEDPFFLYMAFDKVFVPWRCVVLLMLRRDVRVRFTSRCLRVIGGLIGRGVVYLVTPCWRWMMRA